MNIIKIAKWLQAAGTSDIKVEHPGILEVPEGKDFSDLPQAHYISLAKSKGKAAVMKALLNLERWNKSKAPEVSSKARKIIDGLMANKSWQDIESKSSSYKQATKVGDLVMPPHNTKGDYAYNGVVKTRGVIIPLTTYKLNKDHKNWYYLEDPSDSKAVYYINDGDVKHLQPSNYKKSSIPPLFSFEDADGEKHFRRDFLNDEDYNEFKTITQKYKGQKQIDEINKLYKDKGYKTIKNRF
jgi:hypothetical protein